MTHGRGVACAGGMVAACNPAAPQELRPSFHCFSLPRLPSLLSVPLQPACGAQQHPGPGARRFLPARWAVLRVLAWHDHAQRRLPCTPCGDPRTHAAALLVFCPCPCSPPLQASPPARRPAAPWPPAGAAPSARPASCAATQRAASCLKSEWQGGGGACAGAAGRARVSGAAAGVHPPASLPSHARPPCYQRPLCPPPPTSSHVRLFTQVVRAA